MSVEIGERTPPEIENEQRYPEDNVMPERALDDVFQQRQAEQEAHQEAHHETDDTVIHEVPHGHEEIATVNPKSTSLFRKAIDFIGSAVSRRTDADHERPHRLYLQDELGDQNTITGHEAGDRSKSSEELKTTPPNGQPEEAFVTAQKGAEAEGRTIHTAIPEDTKAKLAHMSAVVEERKRQKEIGKVYDEELQKLSARELTPAERSDLASANAAERVDRARRVKRHIDEYQARTDEGENPVKSQQLKDAREFYAATRERYSREGLTGEDLLHRVNEEMRGRSYILAGEGVADEIDEDDSSNTLSVGENRLSDARQEDTEKKKNVRDKIVEAYRAQVQHHFRDVHERRRVFAEVKEDAGKKPEVRLKRIKSKRPSDNKFRGT